MAILLFFLNLVVITTTELQFRLAARKFVCVTSSREGIFCKYFAKIYLFDNSFSQVNQNRLHILNIGIYVSSYIEKICMAS